MSLPLTYNSPLAHSPKSQTKGKNPPQHDDYLARFQESAMKISQAERQNGYYDQQFMDSPPRGVQRDTLATVQATASPSATDFSRDSAISHPFGLSTPSMSMGTPAVALRASHAPSHASSLYSNQSRTIPSGLLPPQPIHSHNLNERAPPTAGSAGLPLTPILEQPITKHHLPSRPVQPVPEPSSASPTPPPPTNPNAVGKTVPVHNFAAPRTESIIPFATASQPQNVNPHLIHQGHMRQRSSVSSRFGSAQESRSASPEEQQQNRRPSDATDGEEFNDASSRRRFTYGASESYNAGHAHARDERFHDDVIPYNEKVDTRKESWPMNGAVTPSQGWEKEGGRRKKNKRLLWLLLAFILAGAAAGIILGVVMRTKGNGGPSEAAAASDSGSLLTSAIRPTTSFAHPESTSTAMDRPTPLSTATPLLSSAARSAASASTVRATSAAVPTRAAGAAAPTPTLYTYRAGASVAVATIAYTIPSSYDTRENGMLQFTQVVTLRGANGKPTLSSVRFRVPAEAAQPTVAKAAKAVGAKAGGKEKRAERVESPRWEKLRRQSSSS